MRPKGIESLEKLVSDLSALRNQLVIDNAQVDLSEVLEHAGKVINNWAGTTERNTVGANPASSASQGSVKCPHCHESLKVSVSK